MRWRALRRLLLGAALLAAAALPSLGVASASAPLALTLPLGERETVRTLGGDEVSMLRDPTQALSLEQVTAPDMASRFTPLSRGVDLNYTEDAIWLRIVLQRRAKAPTLWRLELTNTLLNDVRLFLPQDDGTHQVLQAGDRFPFAERQVAFRSPVFELSLPDERPRVFHLRLQSDSTMSSVLILRQRLISEASMYRDALWVGGLLGIVLISVIFFLQAWFVNRDRLLLSAAAATVAFALAASANLGLLSQYLLPRHPALADGVHPLAIALYFWLLCRLLGQALDLRRLSPRMARLQAVAPVLCFTASFSRLAGLYSDFGGLMMMCGMLFGLGWGTAAAWVVWRASGRGLLTAVGLSVFTTSFAMAPLVALGLLLPTAWWEAFWVVGSVGFIAMAQFSTLEEVRHARFQRREAHKAAQLAQSRADQELAWRRQQAAYFAGVAHDLRTPLSAVRFGLANLERSLGGAAAASRERMDRLQASAQRASDMIERHLQLQHLDQPDVELLLQPASPGDCLEQARAAVAEAWPRHEFRVRVDPEAPPQLMIDTDLVVRALVNLLSNAAKASPEAGVVDGLAQSDGRGGVRFEVRDRGPGLGAVSLQSLLEMHWRRLSADPQGAGHGEAGFGIGLPLVARIASLHQGSVEYRREEGATVFSLWLPALSLEESSPADKGHEALKDPAAA